jgi:hypothetical protein
VIRQHLSQNKFQLGKVKDYFWLYFPIIIAENAVKYDTYGIWTSFKNVLTPLNVNRYQLLKNLLFTQLINMLSLTLML